MYIRILKMTKREVIKLACVKASVVGKFTSLLIKMDINGLIGMIGLLLAYGLKYLYKEIKYVYVLL